MILSDVLKVLATHCKKLGIEHKDLYLMLFEEEDINIEQTVKNVFGKRALNQRIFKKIIMDDGFVHLTNIIKSKLLSTIGGHQALYQSLYQLVENDTHLSHTSSLNIITQLLPKGFIAEPDFLIKGKTETGTIKTAMELCTECTDHIAIIGDGGIGKTLIVKVVVSKSCIFGGYISFLLDCWILLRAGMSCQ